MLFDEDFEFTIEYGLRQRLIVLFTLVRIGDGKVGNGSIELLTLSEIASDDGRLAGTGVGMGQGSATESCILVHDTGSKQLYLRLDLHVFELTDIEMPVSLTFCPAKENITC